MAGHLFFGIIRALDKHVRFYNSDKFKRRVLVEERHKAHAFKRGKDMTSFLLGNNGTARPFQRANGPIRIQPNNERITKTPRGVKVSNMARW